VGCSWSPCSYFDRKRTKTLVGVYQKGSFVRNIDTCLDRGIRSPPGSFTWRAEQVGRSLRKPPSTASCSSVPPNPATPSGMTGTAAWFARANWYEIRACRAFRPSFHLTTSSALSAYSKRQYPFARGEDSAHHHQLSLLSDLGMIQ
jgi:hypothetical protein